MAKESSRNVEICRKIMSSTNNVIIFDQFTAGNNLVPSKLHTM